MEFGRNKQERALPFERIDENTAHRLVSTLRELQNDKEGRMKLYHSLKEARGFKGDQAIRFVRQMHESAIEAHAFSSYYAEKFPNNAVAVKENFENAIAITFLAAIAATECEKLSDSSSSSRRSISGLELRSQLIRNKENLLADENPEPGVIAYLGAMRDFTRTSNVPEKSSQGMRTKESMSSHASTAAKVGLFTAAAVAMSANPAAAADQEHRDINLPKEFVSPSDVNIESLFSNAQLQSELVVLETNEIKSEPIVLPKPTIMKTAEDKTVSVDDAKSEDKMSHESSSSHTRSVSESAKVKDKRIFEQLPEKSDEPQSENEINEDIDIMLPVPAVIPSLFEKTETTGNDNAEIVIGSPENLETSDTPEVLEASENTETSPVEVIEENSIEDEITPQNDETETISNISPGLLELINSDEDIINLPSLEFNDDSSYESDLSTPFSIGGFSFGSDDNEVLLPNVSSSEESSRETFSLKDIDAVQDDDIFNTEVVDFRKLQEAHTPPNTAEIVPRVEESPEQAPPSERNSERLNEQQMEIEAAKRLMLEPGRYNQGAAVKYLIEHRGDHPTVAVAYVGNMMAESSYDINPAQLQNPIAPGYPNGPGRGIVQWEVGGRFDHATEGLLQYAASVGKPWDQLETQLGFVVWETTNGLYETGQHAKVLDVFQRTGSLADTAVAVREHYERADPNPATNHDAKRVQYAYEVGSAFDKHYKDIERENNEGGVQLLSSNIVEINSASYTSELPSDTSKEIRAAELLSQKGNEWTKAGESLKLLFNTTDMSPRMSTALVGNLMYEDTQSNGQSDGFNLRKSALRSNIEEYARQNGSDSTNLLTQLGFIIKDLSSPSNRDVYEYFEEIARTKSVGEVTAAIREFYIIPYINNDSERIATAVSLEAELHNQIKNVI